VRACFGSYERRIKPLYLVIVTVVDPRVRFNRIMWLEVAVDEFGVPVVLRSRMDMFGWQQRQTEDTQHGKACERRP